MKRSPTILAGTVIAAVLIYWFHASTERASPPSAVETSSAPNLSVLSDEASEANPPTNVVITQDVLETSGNTLASEENTISPESEQIDARDYQVDRPNPFDLRSEFANEGFDTDWAPKAERDIREHLTDVLAARSEYRERYALTSVRCRLTLCEAIFTDYNNHQDPPSIFEGNLHITDLYPFDQPWPAQFDRSQTKMLMMPSGGILEQRLYLRRADADIPSN